MPTRAIVRDEETYQRFLTYVEEVGLLPGIRTICLKYAVSIRDVYLDVRGVTVHAARTEIWFWLMEHWGKSNAEIARLFGREHASILYAIDKLKEQASKDNVVLSLDTVTQLCRKLANAKRNRSSE